MRSLQSFAIEWRNVPLQVYSAGQEKPLPQGAAEIEATMDMVARLKIESADQLGLDAAAACEMAPGMGFLALTTARLVKAYMALLQELVDEPLPSEYYADVNLAYMMIANISDIWARVNVFSAFAIALAKAGQVDRARNILDTVPFVSDMVHFETALAVAKITNDHADLKTARAAANYLLFSEKVRWKILTSTRAFLALYEFTKDAECDLFLARQEVEQHTVDPEEAARTYLDIYQVTHLAADMEAARKFATEVVDLDRRVKLQSLLGNRS